MKVKAIKCPACQSVVWSRHRHDCRRCDCGACAIDGGRDYVRVLWESSVTTPPETFDLEVEARVVTPQVPAEEATDEGANYFGVAYGQVWQANDPAKPRRIRVTYVGQHAADVVNVDTGRTSILGLRRFDAKRKDGFSLMEGE